MKTIIAISSLLLPLSVAARPVLSELKTTAGADVRVAVPAARAIAAAGQPQAATASQGDLPNPKAEVIVLGQVLAVADSGIPGPISEHSPNWKVATVKVGGVLKGGQIVGVGGTIEVYFPVSQDIVWLHAPKFQMGQTGVWFLERRDIGGKARYTALHPADFQPVSGPPRNGQP